jgi:hypothetical protein
VCVDTITQLRRQNAIQRKTKANTFNVMQLCWWSLPRMTLPDRCVVHCSTGEVRLKDPRTRVQRWPKHKPVQACNQQENVINSHGYQLLPISLSQATKCRQHDMPCCHLTPRRFTTASTHVPLRTATAS